MIIYKNYSSMGISRCEAMAMYIIQTGETVRQTALVFNISKSTVHKDLTTKLKYENLQLYKEVNKVLQHNKQVRHIRGGMATRLKYHNKKLTDNKSKNTAE